MKRVGSGRGLRLFLALLGAVMVVAGTTAVLFGASSIAGVDAASPAVDSEMRFFAVWYVVAGAMLLRAIPRLEGAGPTVRLVGAAFFVAGCARILSWAVVGEPPTTAVVLMVIELILPFVIVPWQAGVARGRR